MSCVIRRIGSIKSVDLFVEKEYDRSVFYRIVHALRAFLLKFLCKIFSLYIVK